MPIEDKIIAILDSKFDSFFDSIDTDHIISKSITDPKVKETLKQYTSQISSRLISFQISSALQIAKGNAHSNVLFNEQLTSYQVQPEEMFKNFVNKSGAAISEGINGDYLGVATSLTSVIYDLVSSDEALREEVHQYLTRNEQNSHYEAINDLVQSDLKINQISDHIATSERNLMQKIKIMYSAGCTSLEDYHHAISFISNATLAINRYLNTLDKTNKSAIKTLKQNLLTLPSMIYDHVTTKIISDYLKSTQKTAKISTLSEVSNLFNMSRHKIRNLRIKGRLKDDVALNYAAKNGEITLSFSAREISLITAKLKSYDIRDFNPNSDEYLNIKLAISKMIRLLTKRRKTNTDMLALYADYCLNLTHRQAYHDVNLNNQILPQPAFLQSEFNKGKKYLTVSQTLSLLYWPRKCMTLFTPNPKYEQFKDNIQTIIAFYFNGIKHHLNQMLSLKTRDETAVNHLIINLINRELHDSTPSTYYQSFLTGVSTYLKTLSGRGNIEVKLDPDSTHGFSILYKGPFFKKLQPTMMEATVEQEPATMTPVTAL